uniref:DUF3572 domain-containing protein n=1 Tax=Pararhizobium sp. IMCC3301 TaxID=3067904 RepID=UPI002741C53C|nr:DUF3572 domain-containing protein [Pararhizobium sp. IMCC3301]
MKHKANFERTNRESAEATAVQALGFLAQDKFVLERFLSVTGIAPDRVRQAAATPGFLAGVLDYIMQNESLLLTFSANHNVDAETIVAAHRCLCGPNSE